MKRVKVDVTQEIIDRAYEIRARDSVISGAWGRRCPIALALQAAGFPDAYVPASTYFRVKGYLPAKRTQPKVREFIKQVDRREPVQPMSFTILVPDEWMSRTALS